MKKITQMQWFEKIYKERFSSENIKETESGLDGIDSIELWAQISQSIPQEEPIKKAHFWWRSLGVLLFLGLLASTFIFLNKNQTINEKIAKSNPTSIKTNYETTSEDVSTSTITQEEENQVTSIEKPNIEDSETKDINNKNYKSNSTDISLEANRVESSTTNKTKQKGIQKTTPIQSIEDNTRFGVNTRPLQKEESNNGAPSGNNSTPDSSSNITINTKSKKESSQNKSVQNDPEKETKPSSIITYENADQTKLDLNSEIPTLTPRPEINIKNLDLNWLQKPERNIKSPVAAKQTKPIIDISSRNPWSIKLIAQINTFDQEYNDGSNPETFASLANESIDSLQYGSGFGVHLGYNLNRTWSISSGLEYNQYENKLSNVISTDTMVYDSLNQKFRDAENIRTVRHTNKISTLTIPLNIAYDYSLSPRFGIGTSIGVSYSLVMSQDVKLLGRDDTIIDLENATNKYFDNYFSLRLNPYIRYRLTDHFDLMMDVGFAMQNHGTSALLDLKHGSIISSIGLGLKYSFDY